MGVRDGLGASEKPVWCSGERRDGGSQELAPSGDSKPCGLGRKLPSPAPSPAFSESPGPLATCRWTSW